MTIDPFTVTAEELREELAADLGRGGYVFRDDGAGVTDHRYFDKYLVLSRPGLLSRAARLLASLVPQECERIATTGVAAVTLGTSLSQEIGVPLLLGRDPGDEIVFEGELFPEVKVILLEDVTFTGQRAVRGASALKARGANVLQVLCLLDRQSGAAQLLAENGLNLSALFNETQLRRHASGAR